jgi:hypothetical protein
MSTRIVVSAAAWVMLAGAAAAAPATTVISQPDQRTRLQLTVYNQNLGLVREVRRVAVPQGEFLLEFQGVPSEVQPKTLLVETSGGTGLSVIEQNFEFDLMSREKILEKYVGREVAWAQEEGGRITGRLLGVAQGPVYEVGESCSRCGHRPAFLAGRPARVADTGLARPDDRAGDADRCILSHSGLSWAADYDPTDPAGTEGDCRRGSRSTIAAGPAIRRRADARGRRHPPRARAVARSYAGGEDGWRRAGGLRLSDYHLYRGGPHALDNQMTSALFEVEKVEVAPVHDAAAPLRGGGSSRRCRMSVSYAFENCQANHLGHRCRPASLGYGQLPAAASCWADRIAHTPRDGASS